MRPRGLLLRLPATLRRRVLRVGAAGLALLLLAPVPVAGSPGAAGPNAVAPPSAGLPPPAGTTTLVSQRLSGGFAAGGSAQPSISASGRYVAFASGAADLVRGDTNGAIDVFVRDRTKGTTTRLPIISGRPVPTGGQASDPAISADGSVVAFTYQPPSGLAAAAGTIVLAWTRSTGRVEIVSRTIKGSAAQGSREASVSADGRFVAYTSDDPGIVIGDGNRASDVFRYDRQTQQTVLVSAAAGPTPAGAVGGTPSGASSSPSISADGNLVAFVSAGGDTIVHENTGEGPQVYVRDIAAGTTQRISAAPDSGPANGPSAAPSISGDGRYVAFESSASNLVSGDGNQATDAFRRDRQAGTTVLVSVRPDGSPATGESGQASISSDGRMVAFASSATDVVAGLPGARLAAVALRASEAFIRDIDAQDTVLVSVDPAGNPGGGRSLTPVVGGNGRFIAFASTSPNLVRGDGNNVPDVFLRDLPPDPRLNPPTVDFGTQALGSPPTAGAATLANAGWGPLSVTGSTVTGTAKAEFPVSLDGCARALLHRGEACTVTMAFSPARTGTRTATLQVAFGFTGSPRTVRLRGTGSQARIVLDPPIGPPGTVVVATGTGFPPGADVRLSWSRGITPKLDIVTADARGTFRVQVLVFHNDQIGTRDLQAVAAGRALFPPVSVSMLVTAASAMPPGFIALYRFVDLPLVLVIRG